MVGKLAELVFTPELPGRNLFSRIFTVAALGGLFAVGIAHWTFFFQFGEMAFDRIDWPKEYYHYSVLRSSIAEGVIPYFVSPSRGPDTFLGTAETVLSPQIILLPFMSVGRFVLVNTLIMYSLGFLGCLLLRKRYQLSLLPFVMLFLLFNFNGHITSHISVGHSMWNGYFLLPFFVLLILQLLNRERPITIITPVLLAFTLFGVVLQGSLHIYLWCLMLLALLGLLNSRYLKPAGLAILFSVGLSLFRLLPTAVTFAGWKPAYASGFPTIATFVDALTTVNAHWFEHPRGGLYDVGWWEHDVYIGYIGVAFIAFFGIYHRFSQIPSVQRYKFQPLDLPLLLITLFSFGIFFDLISDLRIPLVSWAERVPSRFFIMPLVFLIVIASIRMQALLHLVANNRTIKVLLLFGILLQAHSLAVHSWFWRVESTSPTSTVSAINYSFNLPGQQDLVYTTVVNASAVLSALAIAALCGLFVWSLLRQRG